jgi:hypothetical protein
MNGSDSHIASDASSGLEETPDKIVNGGSISDSTSQEDETTFSNSATGDGPSSVSSLARRETQLVRSSKLLVCFILAVAATTGAVITYTFLEREEEESMAKQVSSASADCGDKLQSEMF